MRSPAADNLIIGYGNRLRGDDGAGPAVVDRLIGRAPADRATLIVEHQLLPEMVDDLARADRVLFIDASVDLPAGCVRMVRVAEQDASAEPGATAHHLTPAALLSMCRAMYHRAPQGRAIVIGVDSLAFGEWLSPPVRSAVERVEAMAMRWMNDSTSLATGESSHA